ncbi:MAG: GNAT family N-acetyltransferase [Gemmatimonadetes bacterium]|nr:GNAT family N-acetyltransferase [Gemmatimonadota bacterium]
MTIIETGRLRLREADADDAPFILRLLNDPAWIDFIGDRGIRDLDGAREYITVLRRMYEEHGHGLWVTVLRETETPVGLCGFVTRDTLEYPDLGYALLGEHRKRGYAREAATATLEHGWSRLGLTRIAAIVSPRNAASIALLHGLGFRFERPVRLSPDPAAEELSLFLREPGPAGR